MIKVINNPMQYVLMATEELYPNIKVIVQFNPEYNYPDSKAYACFPDDGSIPLIEIDANVPFYAVPELLAHELAHIIAGEEVDHNEEWDRIFDEIYDKGVELFMKDMDSLK